MTGGGEEGVVRAGIPDDSAIASQFRDFQVWPGETPKNNPSRNSSGLTLARKPSRKTQPGFSVRQSVTPVLHDELQHEHACVRRPRRRRRDERVSNSAHFTTVVVDARLSKGMVSQAKQDSRLKIQDSGLRCCES